MEQISREPYPGRKSKNDPIPLIVNLLLVLGAAVYFCVYIPFHRKQMDAISLDENRYIRMEWNLLQELKIQTDRQLMEKDREIAELRERYRKALSGPAPASGIEELEERLRNAEKERRSILAGSVSSSSTPDRTGSSASVTASLDNASSALRPPALDVLLLARIDEQKAELAAMKLRTSNLEEKLAVLRTAPAAGTAQDEAMRIQGRALRETLEALKSRKAEADRSGTIDIDDLNAWALLRALANTQSVKEQYPELLAAMERYVAEFGNRRFYEGKSEAYSDSMNAIDKLSRGVGR